MRHLLTFLLFSLNVSLFAQSKMSIPMIQGDSSASKFVGQRVEVRGVVILDLQKTEEQKGFYLQDSTDGNTSTSNGIFVYNPSMLLDVQTGQTVKVVGDVAEFNGLTELTNIQSIVKVADIPLFPLDTAIVSFPVDSAGALEKYEGMLVKLPQKMVVTENYDLGRYGELTLSVNDRLYQPSEVLDLNDADPNGTTSFGTSNLASILDKQSLNARSRIVLSDYLSTQNPNPIPFIDTLSKTIRCGSFLENVTGVLSYGFSNYLIYPLSKPNFQYGPRPGVPDMMNSNVVLMGMNVLNFFNGDGMGGGFPTSRGAATLAEFERQKNKIIAAIIANSPEIIGLMEMENDAQTAKPALTELVTQINDILADSVFASIKEPDSSNGNAGTDEIKVALMYQTKVVAPVGEARYYYVPAFINLGRPPLAQTFRHLASGDTFTVIVNHFKSKGCTNAQGDNVDKLDGQGCYNARRKLQAEALNRFIKLIIETSGDSDIVTLGDFNSYGQEDPLDILRSTGLIDLTENTYSYAFDTQFGSLDHAFVNSPMHKKVVKATKWHVNSDEPPVIDYTLAFKTQDLYQANAYRYSDHDPVLVGFRFESIATSLFTQDQTETLRIYPNPVHQGTLHFSEICTGKVWDAFGRLVCTFDQQSEIDTSLWTKGVYYLQMKEGKSLKVLAQ